MTVYLIYGLVYNTIVSYDKIILYIVVKSKYTYCLKSMSTTNSYFVTALSLIISFTYCTEYLKDSEIYSLLWFSYVHLYSSD